MHGMAGEDTRPLDELPTRPTGRILRSAEADAWQDGFSFLSVARREAKQMRDAARRAYASEYAQGYEDGKAEGSAEAARLINETVVKVDRYLAGLEKEVATLALDIVGRVLGDFDVDQLVAKAARQVISDIRRAKYVRVSVHPDAVSEVRREIGALMEEDPPGYTVEALGDSTLAPQACIIATDVAVIDASIEAQLKAMISAIGLHPRDS
jgi:type III secretion protein L